MFLGLHDVLFPTVHVSPPSSFSNHSQWTCSAHTDCVNCQSAVQIRHAHPDIPTSSSTIGILHMIGPNTFWFDSILLPHFSPLHATYATISPSFYHTFWYNMTGCMGMCNACVQYQQHSVVQKAKPKKLSNTRPTVSFNTRSRRLACFTRRFVSLLQLSVCAKTDACISFPPSLCYFFAKPRRR